MTTASLTRNATQDFQYAFRILRRNPIFSIVCILTLALGIGANTAVFSVVYGVLFRPLPYPKQEQLVEIFEVDAKRNHMNFADGTFADIRAQSQSLQGAAEYAASARSVLAGDQASRLFVAEVSRDFFSVMGIDPVYGRPFSPQEQQFGTQPVALVSYGYWKQALGGTSDWSQVKLNIEHHPVTIIGVLPAGFSFPANTDIWVPRESIEEPSTSRTAHNWPVIGRLRNGVSPQSAQAELTAIATTLKRQYGADTDTVDMAIILLQNALTDNMRGVLWVCFAAVGFLLLVSCANAVNLLLAQMSARQGELAIRAALGASLGRLVRQFLTESLVLSFCGGGLGILAAVWGVGAIAKSAPKTLPSLAEVSVNVPVLIFGFAVSLLVAVGLGIITAFRLRSANLQSALGEGNRSQAGNFRRQRLRTVILSVQVAITVILTFGAGLLGRSLMQVLTVDPGFRTDHIVAMDLALPFFEQPTDPQHRIQFLNVLLDRLRRVPGVDDVGGGTSLPLKRSVYSGSYLILKDTQTPTQAETDQLFRNPALTNNADYCVTSEGFFRVLGIPLVRGRLFDDRDNMDSPHVVVVNESVAKQRWPHEDAVGHTIEFGNMDGDLKPMTIIGVVGDIRQFQLERAPRPTVYVNYRQRPKRTAYFTIIMRTGASPDSVMTAARQILHDVDPAVAPSFSTFTQVIAGAVKMRRFNVAVVGSFAGTALMLTMLGIYGVMSYSVVQRTREIGVRMAVGASAGSIMRLIIYESVIITAIGFAAGILGSFLLIRTITALLFGVSATDPLTSAAVAILLFLITIAASYFPARRATRVDPLIALRSE